MAEQVVITTGQTGVEAPAKTEASATERPGWLPEKFQSPEDMAKAYSELEKKLGQGGTKEEQKPATQEQPQAQNGEQKNLVELGYVQEDHVKTDEDRAFEVTTYGEALADVFEKAGLKASVISEEFHKTGKFPDYAYAALEGRGFSRSVVDGYLRGQAEKAESQKLIAEKDIASIKEVAGGEQQFKEMLTWAVQNLSKEEQDAYDSMVSGNVAQAKAAVEWLKSKYEAKEGSEPKLIHGGDKADEAVFRSTAEVTAAMKDPKYKKDPAYRAEVAAKLSRSKVF